jgi:hypothetical protein
MLFRIFFYLGDGLLFCAANINEDKHTFKLMVCKLDKLTLKDRKFGFGVLRHGEGGGEPHHGEQRATRHQECAQHCQG